MSGRVSLVDDGNHAEEPDDEKEPDGHEKEKEGVLGIEHQRGQARSSDGEGGASEDGDSISVVGLRVETVGGTEQSTQDSEGEDEY